MLLKFKKLVFVTIFNSSLFLILMIGIQNTSNKVKVNFIIDESIRLPISFVVGLSFISGSLIGSFSPEILKNK